MELEPFSRMVILKRNRLSMTSRDLSSWLQVCECLNSLVRLSAMDAEENALG